MSRPRNPPSKMFRPCWSLRFTHQVKFSSSLWKTRSRKAVSPTPPFQLPVVFVDAQRRPCLHRRIDVAERPLIGRQLAIRMHHPDLAEQQQLALGEFGIDQRQADAVEAEVPGGEPGIFPLVGHRDDVGRVEMPPGAVAAGLACIRRRRLAGVAVQPFRHVEIVELLAPQHARRRPGAAPAACRRPRCPPAARRRRRRLPAGAVPPARRIRQSPACSSAPRHSRTRTTTVLAGRHRAMIDTGDLGAAALRIDRLLAAVDDEVVDPVLEVARRPGGAEDLVRSSCRCRRRPAGPAPRSPARSGRAGRARRRPRRALPRACPGGQ